ncbi:MAG: class I SAM-dependent methyltransferase [Candidatus Pacebacteria bacterium]|nr:class I SAM-dependent methyltransferase [Candidatus Paceibacterota bacterium]
MATETVVRPFSLCQDDEPSSNQGDRTASQDNHCILCDSWLEPVPVVSGVTDRRLGLAGLWSINRCLHCGLEQVQPRPSNELLGDYYALYYNQVEERQPHQLYVKIREAVMNSWLYRYWLWLDGDVGFHLSKPSRPGIRLLDIGCNQGRGMLQFKRSGFSQIEGLDINPIAASRAARLGFKVFAGPVMEFDPPEKFDVVVLANVLEHCPIPLMTLSHVARVLRPGGEVWLSLPNSQSRWRRFFGRAWINWHPPFHLAHYSKQSLLAALTEVGFEAIEVKSVTPGLWLAQSLLSVWRGADRRVTRLRNPLLLTIVLLSILALRLVTLEILWGRFLNLIHRDALIVRARLVRG